MDYKMISWQAFFQLVILIGIVVALAAAMLWYLEPQNHE